MAVHREKNIFPELNWAGNACTPNNFLVGKPVASISFPNGVELGLWGDSPEDMEELERQFQEAHQTENNKCRLMQPHIVEFHDSLVA